MPLRRLPLLIQIHASSAVSLCRMAGLENCGLWSRESGNLEDAHFCEIYKINNIQRVFKVRRDPYGGLFTVVGRELLEFARLGRELLRLRYSRMTGHSLQVRTRASFVEYVVPSTPQEHLERRKPRDGSRLCSPTHGRTRPQYFVWWSMKSDAKAGDPIRWSRSGP
jgi:hypothetical protein